MDFKKFVDKIRDLGLNKAESDSHEELDSGRFDIDSGPLPPMEGPPPSLPQMNPGGAMGAVPRGANSVFHTHMDDTFYAERSEHVKRVRELFGEFGSQISSYILTQSFSEGGVGRIITKLDLVTRGRDGADLAQIENWILKNGADPFCKIVGLRIPGNSPPTRPDDGKRPNSHTVRSLDAPEEDSLRDFPPQKRVPVRTFPQRDVKAREILATPQTHIQKVSVTPVSLNGSEPEVAEPMKIADSEPPAAPFPTAATESVAESSERPKISGFPFAPRKR